MKKIIYWSALFLGISQLLYATHRWNQNATNINSGTLDSSRLDASSVTLRGPLLDGIQNLNISSATFRGSVVSTGTIFSNLINANYINSNSSIKLISVVYATNTLYADVINANRINNVTIDSATFVNTFRTTNTLTATNITATNLTVTNLTANTLTNVSTFSALTFDDGSELTSFQWVSSSFTGQLSSSTFVLVSSATSKNSIFVFLNGIYQNYDEDYTVGVDSRTITFNFTPSTGTAIRCKHIRQYRP